MTSGGATGMPAERNAQPWPTWFKCQCDYCGVRNQLCRINLLERLGCYVEPLLFETMSWQRAVLGSPRLAVAVVLNLWRWLPLQRPPTQMASTEATEIMCFLRNF